MPLHFVAMYLPVSEVAISARFPVADRRFFFFVYVCVWHNLLRLAGRFETTEVYLHNQTIGSDAQSTRAEYGIVVPSHSSQ